jgi:Zn-dependent protease with chaperone function
MSLSLIVLCMAAAAVVTFATSALVALALRALREPLSRLTKAAEARVLLGAALLPLIVGAAVMPAALAPSFGWIADHCESTRDEHDHPHICAAHHVETLPSWALITLASVMLARASARAGRIGRDALGAWRTARVLSRVTSIEPGVQARVLPFDEPQAFVLGAFAPQVFVTRGLVSAAHREHLEAVLAHELAHVRRRDPLRRVLATLALSLHLPGVARAIEQRLARAHEMAADAEAARALGSPCRVAEALVQLTRAHAARPALAAAPLLGSAGAMAFGGSDLEARVLTLLDERPRQDRPQLATLLAAAAALFVATSAGADHVHHGVEIVLGLLGG